MAEITTPRLMAAAKEFNVGKDTLVDFLIGKGFSKDDLKPLQSLRKTCTVLCNRNSRAIKSPS